VANSLWPEQNPENPFRSQYVQLVEKDFSATLTPVDFKHHPDAAAAQISKWVADKTHDKIKDILKPQDVDANTRLALVNAIYFKGTWSAPFTPQATRTASFHTMDGPAKPVALMHQGFQAYEAQYLDVTNGTVPCQLLSLNYLDRSAQPGGGRGLFGRNGAGSPGVSMLVVLPREAADLVKLEMGLTAEQLAGWAAQLTGARVEVFLPKFKIEQRFSLAKNLQALGAVSAFVDPNGHSPEDPAAADFSGMDGAHDLYISKVIHQSFVAVDEHGTEAAAATVVAMGGGSARPQTPPPVFRADHPFLFFIRENATGSILFMGRLADPPATARAVSQ
jgi:serpin B